MVPTVSNDQWAVVGMFHELGQLDPLLGRFIFVLNGMGASDCLNLVGWVDTVRGTNSVRFRNDRSSAKVRLSPLERENVGLGVRRHNVTADDVDFTRRSANRKSRQQLKVPFILKIRKK